MLAIDPKDYWTTATKAVMSYVSKKFAGFFTEADKQDIVADVVTRMWRAQESYDPTKGEEFTWIWTIAKNAVNDAANDKRKRENIGGCWDDRDEFVEELHNRLRQERDKRILLYLAQDLDYEEIAEREGLTKQAAYMAVFHVRQRLDNHAA